MALIVTRKPLIEKNIATAKIRLATGEQVQGIAFDAIVDQEIRVL
jgi:hypothetical protein